MGRRGVCAVPALWARPNLQSTTELECVAAPIFVVGVARAVIGRAARSKIWEIARFPLKWVEGEETRVSCGIVHRASTGRTSTGRLPEIPAIPVVAGLTVATTSPAGVPNAERIKGARRRQVKSPQVYVCRACARPGAGLGAAQRASYVLPTRARRCARPGGMRGHWLGCTIARRAKQTASRFRRPMRRNGRWALGVGRWARDAQRAGGQRSALVLYYLLGAYSLTEQTRRSVLETRIQGHKGTRA